MKKLLDIFDGLKEVFYYEVNIYKEPHKKRYIREKPFVTKVIPVLKQSEYYICLDDPFFTKLEHKKAKDLSYSQLDKPSIFYKHNDSLIYDSGFFYRLYSSKPKKINSIKKELQKFINKEIGFYSSINLDEVFSGREFKVL